MSVHKAVLANRIRDAEEAKEIENLAKYDMGDDVVVQALADRLAQALRLLADCTCGGDGDE